MTWQLSNGTEAFRDEERAWRNGRTTQGRYTIQTPACDRCTQGVMDATNDHLRGVCQCPCHRAAAQEASDKKPSDAGEAASC